MTDMTKTKTGMTALTIGALGVVFGDIGTSPLYALQAVFGPQGRHVAINQTNMFGIISLVIWSITLVVSIKFVSFIMRADNEGEGGILALTSLIKNSKLGARYKWFFILLGLIGAGYLSLIGCRGSESRRTASEFFSFACNCTSLSRLILVAEIWLWSNR
jgi:K+ transporter